jgi:murein L,D-transpeptidase YafK
LDAGQNYVSVHIFPFMLTTKNLQKYRQNRWYEFWQNLKEGYDIFDTTHIPPIVKVESKKYIFLQK